MLYSYFNKTLTICGIRAWHPRRFILTKDVILISHPNSTKLVDGIPLFELEEVSFMQDLPKEGASKGEDATKKDAKRDSLDPSAHHVDGKPDSKEKKVGKTNKIKFHHSFQLRTSQEGYNSGRQYIIQANSDQECQELVEQIRQLAKVATEIFLAKSRFLKAQASRSRTHTQPMLSSHTFLAFGACPHPAGGGRFSPSVVPPARRLFHARRLTILLYV